MKNFSLISICLLFIPWTSISQVKETPDGPNLIDWQDDQQRMKKAAVKKVSIYSDAKSRETPDLVFQFDTSGYIISQISYSKGDVYSHYDFEYHTNHYSYNRFKYEDGKRYCDYKNVADGNGNSIQSFYGQPDGIFDKQTDYTYFYNTTQQVTSIIGKFQTHKSEFYYTYTATGMIKSIKQIEEYNPNWYWQYSYDSLDRLIKEYWYEEEGKDTSLVALSYWVYDNEGRILKEEGKGRGWNDINYEWSSDTLKIDFSQGEEFGPSYNYVFQLSKDKKLVTHMETFTKKGWKEEEKWYEYEFY